MTLLFIFSQVYARNKEECDQLQLTINQKSRKLQPAQESLLKKKNVLQNLKKLLQEKVSFYIFFLRQVFIFSPYTYFIKEASKDYVISFCSHEKSEFEMNSYPYRILKNVL